MTAVTIVCANAENKASIPWAACSSWSWLEQSTVSPLTIVCCGNRCQQPTSKFPTVMLEQILEWAPSYHQCVIKDWDAADQALMNQQALVPASCTPAQ